MSQEKPIGYELRHVTYTTDRKKNNDLLVANEYQHFADGTRKKHLRLIKNMKREVWVVKKGQRTFQDIKQWIKEDSCDRYECRQLDLYKQVNRACDGEGGWCKSTSDALNNPYVFGCSITPQTVLKDRYYRKFKDFITPYSSVAVLDTETDVLHGTEDVVLVTITMKEKAFCGIVRSFVGNVPDEIALSKANHTVDKYLKEHLEKRNCQIEFGFFDNAGQAVKACIDKAHEWQPDFVIMWNMDFDIPKIVDMLVKYGYDPKDVFSDPRIPEEYRFFRYKQGPSQKRIQNGTMRGVSPYERWHIATCPATFFLACAMTTYYRFRMSLGKLPGGYGLDATLSRHLDIGKLNFKETEHLSKLEWHKVMQREYPYEYIAYNIFDCISVELLDEKNKDFQLKFNTRCTLADYTEFKSGPRITEVNMHFVARDNGYVIGTVGRTEDDPMDSMVVNPDDWTMILPSFIMEDSSVPVVTDWPTSKSMLYYHVSDLDITSTYPAVQVALNVSKETTVNEVVKVQGLSEVEKRRFFVNLISGESSATQVCNIGFQMPYCDELLGMFLTEHT